MIRTVKSLLENGVDLLYLYDPNRTKAVLDRGPQTAMIGNYETDGYSFDLNYAIKLTLYVMANEDWDMRRYLFLITDRLKDVRCLEKAKSLNQRDRIDAKFLTIGISDQYDRTLLEDTAASGLVTHIHINNLSELDISLLKV